MSAKNTGPPRLLGSMRTGRPDQVLPEFLPCERQYISLIDEPAPPLGKGVSLIARSNRQPVSDSELHRPIFSIQTLGKC